MPSISPRSIRAVLGFLLLTFGTFGALLAEARTPPIDTARAYLRAIADSDWPAMAALLTPEARYLDRTMAYFDRPVIDLASPDAITDFWRSAAEDAGTEEIRFEIRESLSAGDDILLILDASVRNDGGPWGYPGTQLSATFPHLAHLRTHGSRIEFQEDFVDYDTAGNQIERQIAELKANGRASAQDPSLSFENRVPAARLWAVADPYLQAIQDQAWIHMEEHLAPTARYEDPTMGFFDRGPIELKGRREIVDFWRAESAKAQVKKQSFEVEHRFVAGEMAIVLGRETLTTAGSAWGLGASDVTVSYRRVIVLEVREGHVTEHKDFVDYAAIMAQLPTSSEER